MAPYIWTVFIMNEWNGKHQKHIHERHDNCFCFACFCQVIWNGKHSCGIIMWKIDSYKI